MTDQKPDRQDGDGLLPFAWFKTTVQGRPSDFVHNAFDAKVWEETGFLLTPVYRIADIVATLRQHARDIRCANSGGDGSEPGWHAADVLDYIANNWNLPTRDGAEGADDLPPDAEHPINYRKAFAKPALDAMRERDGTRLPDKYDDGFAAGRKYERDRQITITLDRDWLGRMVRHAWVEWAKTQDSSKPSWLFPYDELSEADKEADRQIGEYLIEWAKKYVPAALSAPVPPADGALEDRLADLIEDHIDRNPGNDGRSIAQLAIRTIVQSPAVAAEPVAYIVLSEELDDFGYEKTRIWWRNKIRADNWCAQHNVIPIPLYVPVQPVAPHLPKDTLDRLANANASAEEIKDALAKAYAILRWSANLEDLSDEMKDDCYGFAGSVQPGAGEREQALRDEIFCLREVVRGVRILDHAGRFKEYDGEPWLRRVRNIGLDHDPVEFNRQAPHSSSETES